LQPTRSNRPPSAHSPAAADPAPLTHRAVVVVSSPRWIPSPCSSGVRRSTRCEPMQQHSLPLPNRRAPPQPQQPHPPPSCDRCDTLICTSHACTRGALCSAQLAARCWSVAAASAAIASSGAQCGAALRPLRRNRRSLPLSVHRISLCVSVSSLPLCHPSSAPSSSTGSPKHACTRNR